MKRIPVIILALILLAFPSTVFADVAPPANPPGSNPWPGSDTTQVRMAAETVLVEVSGNSDTAHVTADFSMHNLGNQDESMAVRFPITSDDGFGRFPEIKDMAIKVAGKPVSFRRASYPDTIRNYGQDHNVPWAEFDVVFPAGKDVAIQVAYNMDGSGYKPITAFNYVLETGAGWKDTIGSADIILRLPYAAEAENVIMGIEVGWGKTTPGGSVQGNEVRWHFENFEPGPDGPVQNMQFVLVEPAAWQNVLKARDNAARASNDSEAWGQLAKTYKGIFLMSKGYREDAGGTQLYQSAVEAYEKCLALNPKDAQWHAGYADLLASRSYWDSFNGPTADVYHALKEIQTALSLAPGDSVVLENAGNIQLMFPDGMKKSGDAYSFPWLAQTPTPHPTETPVAPSFDPATVSGTYQSDSLTLGNQKKARLILTLGGDHSAQLVTRYESEAPALSKGTWVDNGDTTISIAVVDPNQKQTEIKFDFKADQLISNTYPAFYGEAGIKMRRMGAAATVPQQSTPGPAPTNSKPVPKAPAATLPAQKTPDSTPSPPICGSAALVGLLLLGFIRR